MAKVKAPLYVDEQKMNSKLVELSKDNFGRLVKSCNEVDRYILKKLLGKNPKRKEKLLLDRDYKIGKKDYINDISYFLMWGGVKIAEVSVNVKEGEVIIKARQTARLKEHE